MTDWLHDTLAALASPGPWRLFRHVYQRNFVSDGWHWIATAFILWGLLHVALRRHLPNRVIRGFPGWSDLRRELGYTASSLAIMTAANCAALAGMIAGVFDVYQTPSQHGWLWLLVSLPLLIVWQDAYFYWTHRLLHTRWLFKHVHAVHHRSRDPSPWTALSFHPLEALVQVAIVPLTLLFVPLNDGVLAVFTIHYLVRSAHGHAGVETMPRRFVRHWLGGLFSTSTHHHLHHEAARGNYGLWFTWWDRWCGTERADYFERFDKATAPRP